MHINIMSKNMANMKKNKKNNKRFNNRGYSSYVISLPYFLSKETVRSYYRMKDIRAYSTYGQSAWKTPDHMWWRTFPLNLQDYSNSFF